MDNIENKIKRLEKIHYELLKLGVNNNKEYDSYFGEDNNTFAQTLDIIYWSLSVLISILLTLISLFTGNDLIIAGLSTLSIIFIFIKLLHVLVFVEFLYDKNTAMKNVKKNSKDLMEIKLNSKLNRAISFKTFLINFLNLSFCREKLMSKSEKKKTEVLNIEIENILNSFKGEEYVYIKEKSLYDGRFHFIYMFYVRKKLLKKGTIKKTMEEDLLSIYEELITESENSIIIE